MAQILVVDDEKAVLEVIRITLELAGHQVREAGDGAQALHLLGIDPPCPAMYVPDLIIMDIAMPVLDGYSAAMRIYEDPATRTIPILVVSVKSRMKENFQLLPNVKGFVEKPFDIQYLAKLVDSLTKKVV